MRRVCWVHRHTMSKRCGNCGARPCAEAGDLGGEHMWRTVRSRLGMGEDIDSSDKWERGERYD